MVTLARSDRQIVITTNMIDNNLFELNAQNGIIDLESGKLKPHDPSQLNTKIIPIAYDPNAKSEIWDKFLADTCGQDKELEKYLQKAIGYSLSGDISEEVFFILHGKAATGKTSFLEAIRIIMGDYAIKSNFQTFIQSRNSTRVRSDVAELISKRFVVVSEAGSKTQFDSALVKNITGNEAIRARHLYQKAFEFTPRFKLWFSTNHIPDFDASDSGMQRRIRVISGANGETEKNGAIFAEMTRFQEIHEKSKSHPENVANGKSLDIKQL